MTQNDVLSVQVSKNRRVSLELLIATVGGCFLAVMSQIAIPLMGNPIPVTLQTLAVFLLGGVFRGRRAAYSVIAYLMQGCLGLPVFAGGISNPLWIVSPQAGFLLSFILAAYVIGKILEKKPQANILSIVSALILGQLIIFGVGMAWLSFYLGISKSFLLGVVPFLGGAALKVIVASLAIRFYKGYLQI